MWLAMDTSGDVASVAVGLAGLTPKAQAITVGARKHAGALVPMIDDVIARAKVTSPAGLRGVLVTDGPGSFTGLRVSASVAKAMVLTHGLQFRVAPSLLVLAAGATPRPTGPILSVLDALRGELYAAVYGFSGGEVETLLPPTVMTPEQLVDEVGPMRIQGVTGVLPLERLERLSRLLSAPVLSAPSETAPVLLSLISVGGALTSVQDPRHWEPEYGRPAEAQRKWEERNGRPLSPPPGRLG
jgi:tRNA threonylcarbamoyl adenosine modification protein YeaZ